MIQLYLKLGYYYETRYILCSLYAICERILVMIWSLVKRVGVVCVICIVALCYFSTIRAIVYTD